MGSETGTLPKQVHLLWSILLSWNTNEKRARVYNVIKQLKSKGIRAKFPHPTQLRMSLETGEKTFPTLMDAAPTLKELGIVVRVEKREQLERVLRDDWWREEHAEETLHSYLWSLMHSLRWCQIDLCIHLWILELLVTTYCATLWVANIVNRV